jgi:hypothetical protein
VRKGFTMASDSRAILSDIQTTVKQIVKNASA